MCHYNIQLEEKNYRGRLSFIWKELLLQGLGSFPR